jgi:hypothetical protein
VLIIRWFGVNFVTKVRAYATVGGYVPVVGV